jgi:hypothetical protein
MKTSQASQLMQTLELKATDTVQTVTYSPVRRVITITRLAPRPNVTRLPVKRRKAPFRLKIIMAPVSAYSFEPTIQVRSQTKS